MAHRRIEDICEGQIGARCRLVRRQIPFSTLVLHGPERKLNVKSRSQMSPQARKTIHGRSLDAIQTLVLFSSMLRTRPIHPVHGVLFPSDMPPGQILQF